jgi:flagellar hook protein FlgE
MSFQQGLSGLNAASSSLDVIGNNISNASTVGFKSGSANFSDIYAASLGFGNGAPRSASASGSAPCSSSSRRAI